MQAVFQILLDKIKLLCYDGATNFERGARTMYRYLKDLSREELMEIFFSSNVIRERAQEEAIDSAYFWCREYCDTASNEGDIEYQYGTSTWCYMKHKEAHEYEFLCAVSRLQKDFCFLADEWTAKIAEAKRLWCDMGESEFYPMLEEIEEACGQRLQDEFDYAIGTEAAEEAFLEVMVDDMAEYIVDDDCNVYEPMDNAVVFEGKVFERM